MPSLKCALYVSYDPWVPVMRLLTSYHPKFLSINKWKPLSLRFKEYTQMKHGLTAPWGERDKVGK